MSNHSVIIQSKKKFGAYAFIALGFFCFVYFKFKVKHLISGLCPNGRMSCLGKFKRNVINLNQTFWWFMWWCFFMTFCCISIDYGDGYLSAKTQFWIWNISGFIGYEGMHLFIPFLLDVPSQGEILTENPEFYVRKPVLEPRLLTIPTNNINPNESPVMHSNKYKHRAEISQRQPHTSKHGLVKGKGGKGKRKIVGLPEVN